jgi:hypothetical protein
MHFFFAEVVDVEKDDEKAGRAKIRLMEDQSKLKDEELRYARPIFPVTAASHGKSGTSSRLIKGSKVLGVFIDDDKQIPYILGSMPSSGTFGSISDAGRDVVAGISKDPGNFGIKTQDIKLLSPGKLDSKSTPEKAEKEDNGAATKAKIPTLGTKLPEGKNVVDQIKKYDPRNKAGFLGSGVLDLMKNFQNNPAQKLMGMIGGAPVLQSVVTQILNNDKAKTQSNQKTDLINMLNIVMTIINYMNSLSPASYRANVTSIQTNINQLKAFTYFSTEVAIIVSLSDGLTTAPNDSLPANINIIKDNLGSLNKAISTQVRSV